MDNKINMHNSNPWVNMKIILYFRDRFVMTPDRSKDGGPGKLDPKLGSNESFLFLYRYFEKTSEKSLVRCTICKLESQNENKSIDLVFPVDLKQPLGIVRRTDCNTTGMESHIKAHHQDYLEDYWKNKEDLQESKQKRALKRKGPPDGWTQSKLFKTDSNNMKSTSAIAAEKAKKEFQSVYDKALVQLLSKQHIPFTQDFIDIFINWKSKIPPIDVRSSKTLSNHVALRAEEVRSYLVQVLEFCKYKCRSMCFTTDIWSSKTMDSFISLTVQFLTHDMEMVRMVPFVQHINFKHSGVNISLELKEMMQQIGLLNKIDPLTYYLTTDNASNMKLAVKLIGDVNNIRCCCHLLNLVVIDALESIECDSIKKSQEFAAKVKISGKKKEALQEACATVKISYITPKLHNKTRWNSMLTNLNSTIRLKKAINHLAVEAEADWSPFFTAMEWRVLEAIETVLEKALIVTKAFEAEKTPTANLVVYHLYNFEKYLEEMIASSGEKTVRGFCIKMRRELTRRFPNFGTDVLVYAVAHYLDPIFR